MLGPVWHHLRPAVSTTVTRHHGGFPGNKMYSYQKISIFGAKKNIYRELLTNNILYLHIEKNITSK
jgi:hypothetical protein